MSLPNIKEIEEKQLGYIDAGWQQLATELGFTLNTPAAANLRKIYFMGSIQARNIITGICKECKGDSAEVRLDKLTAEQLAFKNSNPFNQ